MPSSKINYQPLYNKSWALIVGVDDYKHFSPLVTAVRGAQAIGDFFREQLGFEVNELYNEQATRRAILRWFGQLRPQPDDRVMFYFGGHGITRPLKSRDQGFLALADSDGYWNALAVDELLNEAEATPAKHILYLLDACFSGLVFGGREADLGVERTVDYLLTRPASYAITAGGAEVVDDDAAGDYSLFTHYLLKSFEDQSLLADGVLRAKEIGNYLEEHVTAHRRGRALPNHGYLHGSGDGDFVFSWDTGPRLSPELEYTLRSKIPEVRWGAVAHLINIAKGNEPEQVLIARERLEEIAQADPDSRVRLAAKSFFDEENALREAEEERGRQEEVRRRLEEAQRKQEDAARIAQEAEEALRQA